MASIPVTFIGVMHYTGLEVGGGPMPGGPPLGIWGGKPPPYVDIGGPGPQPPWPSRPPVDPGYGYPERPVDPGYGYPIRPVDPGYGVPRPPLGIWGGPFDPPRPTHPIAGVPGAPGYQPPSPPLGIWGGPYDPPRPTHPIYFPPPGSQPPLGIWGGPFDPPHPAHPIVLPPNLPPEIPPPDGGGSPIPIDWKVAWTPTTGWIVVGVPSGAHPAPSAATTAKP